MKTKIILIDDADKLKEVTATLQNAQDFMSAYKVLRAHNAACLATKQQPIFTADIVNLAFAIELLLKALLCCEGKKARGHKINELFECFSPEAKLEIKNAFKERLIKTTGSDNDIFRLTFEVRLQQHADTYNYWRYFHEKPKRTFNYQFCENLAEVLNQMAEAKLQRFLIEAQEPAI